MMYRGASSLRKFTVLKGGMLRDMVCSGIRTRTVVLFIVFRILMLLESRFYWRMEFICQLIHTGGNGGWRRDLVNLTHKSRSQDKLLTRIAPLPKRRSLTTLSVYC
jgi:hypothetical protein